MEKVVSINGAVLPGEIAENVVKLLEQYLEFAKRGELSSIGIAAVRYSGFMEAAFATTGARDAFGFVAATRSLNIRAEHNARLYDDILPDGSKDK